MNFSKTLTILLFFVLASINVAQELITDRPDFTESAQAIPAKMIQLEAGVEYEDFNIISTFAYPSILARIGIGHNFEVRLGFLGWLNETINDQSNTYINDLYFEAKYQLTDNDATIPMAILIGSTFPTGDEEISVGTADGVLKFACSYDINDNFGLGVNLGVASADIFGVNHILSLASVALGIGLTDKLGAFVEVYTLVPENEEWQPIIDGGFTYLLSPKLQLDAYIGHGLNTYTPDLKICGGVSYLFGY